MTAASTRLGMRAEAAARGHLQAQGYNVVGANYRCRWGELDIIAWQGATLVFVEVRGRRSLKYGTPEESLSKRKQARLVAAAESYMQECSEPPAHWRIDLVSVRLDLQGRVETIGHLESAVEIES